MGCSHFPVDGYTGYNRLTKDGRQGAPIVLAYCWAHVRRKLYDVAKKNHAPIAEEGLRRIAELYRIEATIKGQSGEARLEARQTRSAPRIKAFEDWLNKQQAAVSGQSSAATSKARSKTSCRVITPQKKSACDYDNAYVETSMAETSAVVFIFME